MAPTTTQEAATPSTRRSRPWQMSAQARRRGQAGVAQARQELERVRANLLTPVPTDAPSPAATPTQQPVEERATTARDAA